MEAESTYGLNRNDVLANTLPDPIIPLRWALRFMWVFAALLLALAFTFPVYALIYAAMSVPLAGVYLYASMKVTREDRDYEELFRGRADFSLEIPPLHPDEAAAKAADEALPPAQRKHTWVRQLFPAAKPVAIAETVFRPDGTSVTQRFWRMAIASPAHRDECLAIAKHLKAAHPSVYQAISDWWHATIADKIAGQIWIGKRYQELNPANKKLVRERGEFELLAGCFIGLRPETWGQRFDQRPYFRDFYTLRKALGDRIPEPDRPTAAVIAAAPWPLRFRRLQIYLGRGFTVDEEIGTRFYWHKFRKMFPAQEWVERDRLGPAPLRLPGIGPALVSAWRGAKRTLSPAYRRQHALMHDAAQDRGARWILGSGWRKMRPVWTHYDRDLPQHTLIGGGSGYGKTVLVQSPLITAIYNGSSVVWLDPKVDAKTISRVFYHASLAGRLDDIVIVSVSRSDSPYNATFNPLSGFFDPSQIGNILAGLMPEDAGQNQYFLDDARNIGRIVGTTVHWLNQFLAVLCNGNDVGFQPPRLLLWLEYARGRGLHHLDPSASLADKRAEIDRGFSDFEKVYDRLRRQDRAFAPADDVERSLFAMWCQPEYSPRFWKLSFMHLNEFALSNRQRLVSWFMRIVYPYVCAGDDRFRDVLFPRSDTLEMVSGFTPRPRQLAPGETAPVSLIELYERSGTHVLAQGALTLADRTKTLWCYLYERVIGVDQVNAIQQVLIRSERSFVELIGQARRDPEEYGQGVANLRPVVNEICAGEKYDLLCVPEPQCSWPVIHHQKKIVIFMLGSMVDQKASDHVSKALVQSLLGYAGHIQDRGAEDIDLLFCGDEFMSWATSMWAHIVDKCRSTGIRTMALCQSQPGMRHALKSNDLFKHIVASIRNVYSCATNLTEDQQTFTEGIAKIPIFRPQRTLGEQPAAAGEAAAVGIAGWGTSESWMFTPEIQPLIEPELIGWLPKGVFVSRVQKEFSFFQAPLLKEVPFSLHAFMGLDATSDIQVEGVHFNVADKSDIDRLRSWGTDDRLASALGRVDLIDPDSVPVDPSIPAPDAYRQIRLDIGALVGPAPTSSAGDASGGVPGDPGAAAPAGASPTPPASQKPPRRPRAPKHVVPLDDPTPEEDAFGAISSDTIESASAEPMDFDPDLENERREAEVAAIANASPDLHTAQAVVDGLVARGAANAAGERTGHWFLYTDLGIPAGDGFYQDGKRVGEWIFRNAGGAVARRVAYQDDQVVSEQLVEPPAVLPLEDLPPGPLPKPVSIDRTDADGLRYRGLLRNGTIKVGMWEILRPDGTRAEIQHYHMVTGKPMGMWERYDARGDLIKTYSPI